MEVKIRELYKFPNERTTLLDDRANAEPSVDDAIASRAIRADSPIKHRIHVAIYFIADPRTRMNRLAAFSSPSTQGGPQLLNNVC